MLRRRARQMYGSSLLHSIPTCTRTRTLTVALGIISTMLPALQTGALAVQSWPFGRRSMYVQYAAMRCAHDTNASVNRPQQHGRMFTRTPSLQTLLPIHQPPTRPPNKSPHPELQPRPLPAPRASPRPPPRPDPHRRHQLPQHEHLHRAAPLLGRPRTHLWDGAELQLLHRPPRPRFRRQCRRPRPLAPLHCDASQQKNSRTIPLPLRPPGSLSRSPPAPPTPTGPA